MDYTLKTLRDELRKIQQAQETCVTASGYVRASDRYRYAMLTERAKSLKESIEWLEAQFYEVNV